MKKILKKIRQHPLYELIYFSGGSSYWSCSKFADKIYSFFGVKKPKGATTEGWAEWKKETKAKIPFVYWVIEEGLDVVRNFFNFPLRVIEGSSYYFRNRFITKTHCLKSGLEKGRYYSLDTRIFYCLMNELVEFIEVEKAHIWDIFHGEKRPFLKKLFRIRNIKPENGIKNLEWEISYPDCPEHQRHTAKEALEIYKWFKEVYLNRKDPHDLSGWSDFCDRVKPFSKRTPEEDKEAKIILDKLTQIEKQQEKEDEEMLIRLIKIRGGL